MPPADFRIHIVAVVLIAIGGALGSVMRYSLGATAGVALPETVLVNAVGSFGLGLLLFDSRADRIASKRLRLVFGTGFFASFTSYSTFIADILFAEPAVAIGYIVFSYGAAFGGIFASRMLVDRASRNGVSTSSREDR